MIDNREVDPEFLSEKEVAVNQINAESYFTNSCQAFFNARVTKPQPGDFFFAVNNFVIKIVFAGGVKEYIIPALVHLACPAVTKPDLTVYCWESTREETSPSFIPWPELKTKPDKVIPVFNQKGVFITVSPTSLALSMLNPLQKKAVFYIRQGSEIAIHEQAAPLMNILMWWLEHKNQYLIHAAVVGINSVGVLIAGPGGSGKSTTAMACLDNNFQFLGEDYVMICKNAGYYAYSLFSSLKLDRNSQDRFPQLKGIIVNPEKPESEKGVFFLNDKFQEKIIRSLKLSAILLPVITGNRNTSIEKITAAEGFRSLAPSTIFQHVGTKKVIFNFLAEMSQKLPCYRVFLGTDLKTVTAEIYSIIQLFTHEK